jgi:hypothetical protein
MIALHEAGVGSGFWPRGGGVTHEKVPKIFLARGGILVWSAIVLKKIKFKLQREDCIMPLEVCNKPMNFLVNSQVFEQNGSSLLKNIFGSRNSFFLRGGKPPFPPLGGESEPWHEAPGKTNLKKFWNFFFMFQNMTRDQGAETNICVDECMTGWLKIRDFRMT